METQLISAKEVASTLGVSKGTAYNLMRKNAIPTVQIGARLLASKEGLAKFIKAGGGDVTQRPAWSEIDRVLYETQESIKRTAELIQRTRELLAKH